jgi:enoyl-CoA hydratase
MSGVTAERSGTTLTLTLDRPEKMNALSAAMVDALHAHLQEAAGDGTRLVVFRGKGKNFSAGFDFTGYEDQSEGDLLLRFTRIEQLLQAVYHAPYDTLVLAHGKNFGAGVDLIGVCSRRVASAEASFRMPGLRFGLVLGSRRFARQVGADRAQPILQEAKTFGADEALRIGFLTAVAPQEQWDAAIAAAVTASNALPAASAARLFAVVREDTRDADLAELVRSAAAPGIKDRIAAYLGNR